MQKALAGSNAEDIAMADVLGLGFLKKNLRQVREMGATILIVFCMGCEAVYRRLVEISELEVLWYPSILERLFHGAVFHAQVDYYPGCFRAYNAMCGRSPVLKTPEKVLSKIEGLEVNTLDVGLCCI